MRKSLLGLGAAIALALPTPALAEWRVAESENFEIYSEEKPADMVELAIKLERFKMLLSHRSGVTKERPGKKLKIYWVDDAFQVQKLIKGGFGYIQGYYVAATPYGAIAVTPGRTRTSGSRHVGGNRAETIDPDVVLFHEYGHHFMLQNFPVAYPPWYVEGFAEFYGYTQFKENGDLIVGNYADVRKGEFQFLGLMELSKLLNVKPKPANSSFYGTSWLLTHYTRFNPERGKELQAYLRDVLSGTESVAAAEKNFTGGVKGLQKDLKKYLSGHQFPKETLGGLPQINTDQVKLTSLAPDRAASLTSEIRFLTGFAGDKDERKKLIASVTDHAKSYSQSAHLKAFLADLYLADDEDDLAIAVASEALALDANHQRARLVKASALMEKAQTLEGGDTKNKEPVKSSAKGSEEEVIPDAEIVVTATRTKASEALWAEARKLIVASNRSDSEDPLPLYLYYEYLKRRNEQISPTATDGLAKAHMLIPQYSPLRLALANEYSNQGDNVAAAAVIKPEAFSPHGGAGRRKAQALLKRYECLAADPAAACEFKEKTADEEKKEEEAKG